MKTNKLRKALSLLTALLLMAGALPAGAQETAPVTQLFGSRLLDDWGRVNSMVMLDGTVYMLSDKALYTWREGEKEARELAPVARERYILKDAVERVSALFIHENKLMGFDPDSAMVYALHVEGDTLRYEKALALDWSDFEEGGGDHIYYTRPGRIIAQDDELFVSFDNWDSSMANDLFSFNLKTGAMTKYSPTFLKGLVPYKDGKLLGLYYDQNTYDPVTYEQFLAEPVLFDPRTDSAEPFSLRLPEPGRYDNNQNLLLYADRLTGDLYAANENALYRISAEADPVMTGRLPMAGVWGGGGLTPSILPLGEDRLLIAFGPNVLLRSMDEENLAPVTALKMNANYFNSSALTKTLMQLDDIVLDVYAGDWQDAAAINTLFLTGAMEYDILSIDHRSNDPQKMVNKGYFAPLDDTPALKAYADDAFDVLQPFLHQGSELCLLPTRLDTYYPAAYSGSFEAVGAKIPTSIPDLLDLARWWSQHHAQHEEYVLFDQPDAGRVLKDIAYNAYMDQALGEKRPLSFDMDSFGKIMREIDSLDVSGFDVMPEELGEEAYLGMQGQPLIINGMGYDLQSIGVEGTVFMELSFDGISVPRRFAYAGYTGIPSTSKNKEAAKRFLAAYIENMDPIERAAISKSWSEPILNKNFEEEYAQQLEYLAEYEEAAAKATGAEKTQMEAELARVRKNTESFEARHKYTVSAETLSYHKDMMSRVYLPDSLGLVQQKALNNPEDQIYLMQMYLDGAITLEQFMADINAKIRLMTLEAQ